MNQKNNTQNRLNTFNIYTAIDIMGEKCVRLYKGDFDSSTTYNNDPDFVAKRWKSLGAKFLHIVDLDGARRGQAVNIALIRRIITEAKLPVQVGGGIRNTNTIKRLLDVGATRVILGSAIVKDPDFVKSALQEFGGERIVLGIDCREGYLAVEGWLEHSNLRAEDIVKEYEPHGLKIIQFTDIDRDGTLEGPNMEALVELLEKTSVKVIASGGIGSIVDVYEIKNLKQRGFNIDGAIIGKALYSGKIKPSDLFSDDIYY
jgi:phosphoribosylformimino-5-aminoimidazole carboxamide ribotide isomerase